MPSVTVDIDVDLEDFETSDLIKAIEYRGEVSLFSIDFADFIRDCQRAFEKKDQEEFEYLMCKLEKAADV